MQVIVKPRCPDARRSLNQAHRPYTGGTAARAAASVLDLTRDVDNNTPSRRIRRLGARLQPFLDGIQ